MPAERYTFGCPRCESLLEATAEQAGQTGRCPTCDARFVVPAIGRHHTAATPARLLDAPPENPTPLHAYAASGDQAPRILHRPDGTPVIECPRCGVSADVDANACPACGIPFTLEGAGQSRAARADPVAITAVVAGVVGLVCFPLFVPSLLAAVLGGVAWVRSGSVTPPAHVTIAFVLGAIGFGIGLLTH